jgi:hypothetical protein
MGSRKHGRLKHKNHAQDGGTLGDDSQIQRPAILPWFTCFERRPSFRWYGHLARYAQQPDCGWTLLRMIPPENRNITSGIMHRRGHLLVRARRTHDRSEQPASRFDRIMRQRAPQARVNW